MIGNCLICKKEIKTFPSTNKRYCSNDCKFALHRVTRICAFCKKEFVVQRNYLDYHPAKHCSMSCAGKTNGPLRFKQGHIPAHKGKKIKMTFGPNHFQKGFVPWNKGKEWPEMSGKNHPQWKGGTYGKDRKVDWGRKFYQDWRKKVLERDDYQCTSCGSEHYLEVDHIKPYSLFPELRYDINNGRVLCHSCHVQTATYGKKALNFERRTA